MKSRIAVGAMILVGLLVARLTGQNVVPPQTVPPQAAPPQVVPPQAAPPLAAPPAAEPPVQPIAPLEPIGPRHSRAPIEANQPGPVASGFSLVQLTLRNKIFVYVRVNSSTGAALVSFNGGAWTRLTDYETLPPGDYQVLLSQAVEDGAFETARFDRLSGRTWVLNKLVWSELKEPQ